jgi:broad specificity phosphatase PhoE
MIHRTRLYLVRHGETVGESSIRYHGRNDVALSALGRAQMRRARGAIESVALAGSTNFARVFSSPLGRAVESAQIIAAPASPLILIDEFAEVHFGLFEGLTADEIRDRYPDDYARWNADRLAPDYTYPEGESRTAFAERVERGVDKMLSAIQPDDESALVTAHRGVIGAIVRKLTGAQPSVELGSIQILRREVLRSDVRWHPESLDLIDHLSCL